MVKKMNKFKERLNQEKGLLFDFLKEGRNIFIGIFILIGIAVFIGLIYILFQSLPIYLFPHGHGILTIILMVSMLLLIRELNKVKKENKKLRDELDKIRRSDNYLDDDED